VKRKGKGESSVAKKIELDRRKILHAKKRRFMDEDTGKAQVV